MDFYGTGRSNYITIENIEAFKIALENYSVSIEESGDNDNKYGIFSINENGSPDNFRYDETIGDEIELPDFMETVSKFLINDEVFIWVECGNEGQRYCSGFSSAINSKGERENVSLHDIYTKAEKLGNFNKAEF